MARFRVKPNAGVHWEHGREFKAGHVVHSKKDLALHFANKFEKVPDSEPITEEERARNLSAPSEIYDPDNPGAQEAVMKDDGPKPKFKKLPNPKAKKQPNEPSALDRQDDVGRQDEDEDQIYADAHSMDDDADDEEELEGDGDIAEEEETPEDAAKDEVGDECTKDYPKAKKAGMKVFKKGRRFIVCDAENDGSKPLCDNPMTKKETEAFLDDMVK